MKVIKDICYSVTQYPEMSLDIYLPDKDSFKVFVYFHGGGLERGDRKRAEKFAEIVTAQGIALVSVDYRMYPQVIYPQFIYDSAEAVSWVQKNIGEYGNCEGVYVGGSSAGAYISMMLCFVDKYLKRYGVEEDFVKGYLHDAGQPTKHFRVLQERGIDPKKVIVDETAPLYYVGDKEEYPPMMFVVSDDDIKGRYEQTLLMIATLKHYGYDESKIHFKLMNGTHCAYVKTGEFGKIICEFMEKVQ